MQVVVAGNVISFPLSGLTWHIRHSSPRDTCVLWLYGIGCSGPGTGGEIGTCARIATEPASTVLSSEHRKETRSLVIGTEIQHSLRHVSWLPRPDGFQLRRRGASDVIPVFLIQEWPARAGRIHT